LCECNDEFALAIY